VLSLSTGTNLPLTWIPILWNESYFSWKVWLTKRCIIQQRLPAGVS